MKKALLAVSFGTSHLDTLEKTILKLEQELAEAFPERMLYRAFTSRMIVGKLRRENTLFVFTVEEALQQLIADGVEDLLVQPTHIINGEEYDLLREAVEKRSGSFAKLAFGKPLLTEKQDYDLLADALLAELPEKKDDRALVFMGHGSEHYANAAYSQLQYVLQDRGRNDIFIGTVEGYPGIDEIEERIAAQPGLREAVCLPLLIVAGDHAKNDMSSDEPDSWRSRLTAKGLGVTCLLKGLGEYPGVRAIYVAHAKKAEAAG